MNPSTHKSFLQSPLLWTLLLISVVGFALWWRFLTPATPEVTLDDGSWEITPIASGLRLHVQGFDDLFGKPQYAYVLEVDPSDPALEVHTLDGGYECTKVTDLAKNAGAIAGINGGYFCSYTDYICTGKDVICDEGCPPNNFSKRNGTLISTNCENPAGARSVLALDGLDAPRIAQIPPGEDWPEICDAIGAGPQLVLNGKVDITEEGFPWMKSSAPRTCVGIMPDGRLLFVVFDGRQDHAYGLNIPQLAAFMQALGVDSAINFDGGGSSLMYIKDQGNAGIVNKPSDRTERFVRDGLFVFVAE